MTDVKSDALVRILRAEDAEKAYDIFESEMEPIRKQLRRLGGHSPGALDDYILHGGLPFSIGHMDPAQQLYEMIRRVIEKDVPLIGEHDSRTLRSIPALIGMIAPSPDISLNSISRDIDGLSISSVRAVLDTLKRCRLIFEVEKVGSPRSSLRSDTRKYFPSSSLAAAVLSSMGRDPRQYTGQLVETAVSSLIKRGISGTNSMSLRYMKGRGMADLVVEDIDLHISIEIGSGRKGDGPVQLRKTMRETSSKFGILICDVQRPELNNNILKLPLREFLCL
ncbi:MAG: ATP-binding protein [Thermoplasmata archaeon]|nr:ATP-binding protein [Thermoplasmata archaeon]